MIYTDLNKIKEHDPRGTCWRKLLDYLGKTKADDYPLSLATILESNGLNDALWALRCWPEYDREWRLLACYYAEQALPIFEAERPGDGRPRNALEVSRRYADGKATAEGLKAARSAAWDSERDAIEAARTAPTASAGARAARAAAWAASVDIAEAVAANARAVRAAVWVDAGDIAEAAAMSWQKQRLLELVEELSTRKGAGVMNLKPCPCGKTPTGLIVVGYLERNELLISGSCCNAWTIIEHFAGRIGSIGATDIAEAAWNAAPRAVPVVCPQCEGEGVVTDVERLKDGGEWPCSHCPTCAPFGGRGAIMVEEDHEGDA